jgi:hypothetical protein
MGPEDWKRDADSVLENAKAEDVRIAMLGRLAERYAAPDGIVRLASGQELDFRTEPLADLGVDVEGAQIVASFEYLAQLKKQAPKEQFSWTRDYLCQRLNIWYRGSRSRVAYLDSLIRHMTLRRHLDSKAVELRTQHKRFSRRRVPRTMYRGTSTQ